MEKERKLKKNCRVWGGGGENKHVYSLMKPKQTKWFIHCKLLQIL